MIEEYSGALRGFHLDGIDAGNVAFHEIGSVVSENGGLAALLDAADILLDERLDFIGIEVAGDLELETLGAIEELLVDPFHSGNRSLVEHFLRNHCIARVISVQHFEELLLELVLGILGQAGKHGAELVDAYLILVGVEARIGVEEVHQFECGLEVLLGGRTGDAVGERGHVGIHADVLAGEHLLELGS